MNENITARELLQLREQMEKSAALLLGQILFEFARLDMAVGMCISWLDEGRQLEALTKQAVEMSFHNRLEFLKKWVDRVLDPRSKRHNAYAEWIAAADAARLKRNILVHGRWGQDADPTYILHIVGLPNSPDQTEHRYTIDDLEAVRSELQRLSVKLYNLRQKWPL